MRCCPGCGMAPGGITGIPGLTIPAIPPPAIPEHTIAPLSEVNQAIQLGQFRHSLNIAAVIRQQQKEGNRRV